MHSAVSGAPFAAYQLPRWIGLACIVALVSVPANRLSAQTDAPENRVSPVNDMISRAKDALNNLKYADALAICREVLQFGRIRQAQLNSVYQVMAAAFFPEERTNTQADSAVFYLGRAIKLAPDAPLAPELRWPGLDSLFNATRGNTFASVARPQTDYALTGVDGRAFIDVISTRPAIMRLQASSLRDGRVFYHDSSASSMRARLAMRAHNGAEALFLTGDYELQVIVRDVATSAVDTLRFRAMATGVPPVLDAVPTLSTSALVPERSVRTRAKGIIGGLVFGAATVALSQYVRADKPVRSSQPADNRAGLVAFSVLAGSVAGGFLDKGLPIADAVAANTITKAEAAAKTAAAIDVNRKKVADYRVELKVAVEAGR